jgi:hypothetical protein
VDSCGDVFELMFSIDLENENATVLRQIDGFVEIVEESTNTSANTTGSCSKNGLLIFILSIEFGLHCHFIYHYKPKVLLRIPASKLDNDSIIKIELKYGESFVGSTFHLSDVDVGDNLGS